MIRHLFSVRYDVSKKQDEKLSKKWAKYGDYRKFSFKKVRQAVLDELEELKAALESEDYLDFEIRDEILDVRNTTEFLWDFLNQRSKKK